MTNGADLSPQLEASLALVREKREQAVQVYQAEPVFQFTPAQQAMIRDTYANGATQSEFEVLMEIAKLRKLNPLLRQIHFVKRWNKQLGREVWSAQVSIDGLRAIAQRTGLYDGQDEPEYEHVEVGGHRKLICAKVKVYRKDWGRPAVGVAYWSEYVQTNRDGSPTAFWSGMPHNQLAKCAESLALRKAFPDDCSGLYTDEEMGQADDGQPIEVSPHTHSPDAVPEHIEPAEFAAAVRKLKAMKTDVFNPGCDWETMNKHRQDLGTRAAPAEFGRRLSAMYRGDVPEERKKEMSALWQSVERKLTQLEAKLPAPTVEASFIDAAPEDGTAVFSPEAESEEA